MAAAVSCQPFGHQSGPWNFPSPQKMNFRRPQQPQQLPRWADKCEHRGSQSLKTVVEEKENVGRNMFGAIVEKQTSQSGSPHNHIASYGNNIRHDESLFYSQCPYLNQAAQFNDEDIILDDANHHEDRFTPSPTAGYFYNSEPESEDDFGYDSDCDSESGESSSPSAYTSSWMHGIYNPMWLLNASAVGTKQKRTEESPTGVGQPAAPMGASIARRHIKTPVSRRRVAPSPLYSQAVVVEESPEVMDVDEMAPSSTSQTLSLTHDHREEKRTRLSSTTTYSAFYPEFHQSSFGGLDSTQPTVPALFTSSSVTRTADILAVFDGLDGLI